MKLATPVARTFAFVAIACLTSILLVRPVRAQAGQENWSGPCNWERIISAKDANGNLLCSPNQPGGPIGGGNLEIELSHAALMPSGNFAGWVLLWRKEIPPPPGAGVPCPAGCIEGTSVLWAMNPADPLIPYRIDVNPSLPSSLFCAGQSWDRLGQLVFAGGTPESCEDPSTPFPPETYRFRPDALSYAIIDAEDSDNRRFLYTKPPLKQQGDMAIERYYPTVIPLILRSSLQPLGFEPDRIVEGGVNLVVGGPPTLAQAQGNEFWEVLKSRATGSIDWEAPFLPETPTATNDPHDDFVLNSHIHAPHYNSSRHSIHEPYSRLPKPLTNPLYPDRLLDSYPRLFQMMGGDILVCGDVDTAAVGANLPGTTWVIKPRFDNDPIQQPGWELHGRALPGAPAGHEVWRDSFYDNAMLLQPVDGLGMRSYRAIVFGGSRYESDAVFLSCLPGGDPIIGGWVVNQEVWEFLPGGASNPLENGTWWRKVDLTDASISPPIFPNGPSFEAFQRVFSNAVLLPTGEIFIVGGTSVDDHEGGAGHSQGQTAPVVPVIYDPGATASAPGTVYQQGTNPEPGAPHLTPIARLYHSVALLLADGRVLVAGGKRQTNCSGSVLAGQLGEGDPRYSVEIFSPPYLDLSGTGFGNQPVITSAPNEVSFTANSFFEIEATRSNVRRFDKVVLLRPGAVTHHFDNDQRYVELFIQNRQVLEETGGEALEKLTLATPTLDEIPPGYYMLFAVETDDSGVEGHRVPSVARFVRFKL